MKKIKKTDEQLINFFWEASSQCYFDEKTIALIRCLQPQTLASERCNKKGPRYIKANGRILYRKKDVIEFMEGFEK